MGYPFFSTDKLYDSEDPTELDRLITNYESEELSYILNQFRNATEYTIIDPVKAANIVVHLAMRTKFVRQIFTSEIIPGFSLIGNIFTDKDFLSNCLGLNEYLSNDIFVNELKKVIQDCANNDVPKLVCMIAEQYGYIACRENFLNEHKNLLLIIKNYSKRMNNEIDKRNSLIEIAHKKVLMKSNNEISKRIKKLNLFNWQIVHNLDSNFILPDCVVYAFKRNGNFYPYAVADICDLSQVMLPISSSKLLVGWQNGQSQLALSCDACNRIAAMCSNEYFYANRYDDELKLLALRLGEEASGDISGVMTGAVEKVVMNLASNPRNDERIQLKEPGVINVTIQFVEPIEQEIITRTCDLFASIIDNFIQCYPLDILEKIIFTKDCSATYNEMKSDISYATISTIKSVTDNTIISIMKMVLRSGQPKFIILVHYNIVSSLMSGKIEDQYFGIHHIVTCLSHICIYGFLNTSFPGCLPKRHKPTWTDNVYAFIGDAWIKYFTSRVSASFCGLYYLNKESFLIILSKIDKSIQEIILSHQQTDDILEVTNNCIAILAPMFIEFAELAGNFDGVDKNLYEDAEIVTVLSKLDLLHKLQLFHEDLKYLFKKLGKWESLDVFYSLTIHIEFILIKYGIITVRDGDGVFIINVNDFDLSK
jgi:hypothetical protein